ncbi:hypothetical protein ACQ1Q1_06740 [Ornithobacterium rhinotracheale]|uniref:Uncharacterized protein n=1 Tax=Ornithobacterium rhinotracheale (strain ATCC 51463 / DSM 15997 / CCUG 23171 / CIP 104009 / LMG 9086) TaxID=867902 RepID=I4A2H1_ORNRL|nr:hypothetical protein [Ornithobacterium rhinotracheale]AFL98155.1 hypothetical protein Ornrh_2018 [Ornithobacterium rhinotracheale DSM 15997]AIQ00692.1 hypothetical protein Q785_09975 [Ornithobacterium rhinotracheale ORT-UMN 88]KGB66346.1 hypothetical protein Q787_09805 [Ornithobacterium rhinotracheale H06-030791]MCK0193544.1 hypothetical protein [Ornithobacterium rhinotracheale]MCK0201542.1 hypothetical protein [Ornithobacterium rhinotracheale]
MEKQLKIPFRLIKIEEIQLSLFEKNINLEAPVDQNVGFGFGANVEDRIIACSLSFTLEKEDKPFINIEVACHFEIEEKSFKTKLLQKDVLKIDKDFASHLAMITVGTTRGVLYAHTKSTPFEEYFIGLLNVQEMIDEDIEMTL